MTIKELTYNASQYLKEKGIEDPSKEAGLLLSWLLKKDLSYIYSHSDTVLGETMAKEYCKLVKRRGDFEPFAYITGECEFMSLKFEVNKSVLIPRPETEVLAEAAIYALGGSLSWSYLASSKNLYKLPQKSHYRGLDIGTGSGCLAISISKFVPNLSMTALDISEKALEIARQNAVKNNVSERIDFIRANFLSDELLTGEKFHIIVSNPPYIPDGDINSLSPCVRNYEPHTALKGSKDGLMFYKELAKKASLLLEPQGLLAVECGFDQSAQIQHIFSKYNLSSTILKDLSGINRVIIAWDKV
ncbi:MAG: peptide chain release factor N(5)-glutamine methyltransferase [Clostridiaceae bacterium]|nr:peptide chain release factor N(5)-glutamine methyltransferase [Clostridiaceae bacterium]